MNFSLGSDELKTNYSRQGRLRHTRRRALRVVPASVEVLLVVHTEATFLVQEWHHLMLALPLLCLRGHRVCPRYLCQRIRRWTPSTTHERRGQGSHLQQEAQTLNQYRSPCIARTDGFTMAASLRHRVKWVGVPF